MTPDSTLSYDIDSTTPYLLVRYAIGSQAHEVLVDTRGHSLEEHSDRLEALAEGNTPLTYVPWPLASGGGTIAIRLDSIVSIEGRERLT